MESLHIGVLQPLENQPVIHIKQDTPAKAIDLRCFTEPKAITLEAGTYVAAVSADNLKLFGYVEWSADRPVTISLLDIMRNL